MNVSLLPSWWMIAPVCGPTIHTGAVAFSSSGTMKIDPRGPYALGSSNGVASARAIQSVSRRSPQKLRPDHIFHHQFQKPEPKMPPPYRASL